MRRRVVVTGMGCVTPLGTTVPELWANLKEGEVGRRLHDAVRRQQLPHADLGRGARTGRSPTSARTRPKWEKRGRHTQVRHRRGQAGGGRVGRAQAQSTRSGSASISAPAKGSRTFYNFSRMMVAALKNGELDLGTFIREGPRAARSAARARAGAEHAGRLPGDACSTPRARTSTASPPAPPAARPSARRPRSSAAARPT